MLRYAARRLVLIVPTLIGTSILVFLLAHIMPGNPVDALLPENASADDRAQLTAALGLDKPLPEQYFIWLGNALHGDLGTSISSRTPVTHLLGQAIGATLLLSVCAAFIGFLVGGTLGTVAAFNRGRVTDKVVSAIGLGGISVPAFWMAFLLIIVFAVQTGWLPSGGMHNYGDTTTGDLVRHLVMPAVAVSTASIGMTARMVRANVLQVLGEDFVTALRARGMARRTVLKHVFRNVLAPILTVIGLEIGTLLSGSVLVETIFNWPGIGSLLNLAIGQRDMPVIQGGVLLVALLFVLVNLVVDLVHSLVDHRIQRAS